MHQRARDLKGLRVRWLLAAFATVLLAPVLVLAAVVLSQYATSERNRYVEDGRKAAYDIAADLDRELGQAQAAAQALATSRLIQNGNYEAFQEQASEFLQTWVPNHPNTYAVILRDLNGQQLVNTRLPWGTPLPKVERDVDKLVITTKRPQVQDLFFSTSANRFVIALRAPVLKDGQVTHVLSLALEPGQIAQLLQNQQLSPEWNRAVFDRDDRIVARWPGHDRFVGARATETLRRNAVGDEGTFIGTNLEGVLVLAVYARSELSGWRVVIGIPLSVLQKPFRNWRWTVTALFISGFVLLIGLAFLFGRRIAGPIHTLEVAANQLARKQRVSPIATGLHEVDAVGHALAQASTELRRAEQQQRLLVRELGHRMKNALATVRALAFLFLHQDQPLEIAREQFETRLSALSRTHDLLIQGSWEGATLKDVLATELEPYAGEGGPRFTANGPDVQLSPKAVLALGMVFHELATNAVKYGALSAPEGRVEATWRIKPGESGLEVLELKWREVGGPMVKEPEGKGFGSRLVRQTVTRELSGSIHFEFEPSGLRCVLEIPVTESLTAADRQPA